MLSKRTPVKHTVSLPIHTSVHVEETVFQSAPMIPRSVAAVAAAATTVISTAQSKKSDTVETEAEVVSPTPSLNHHDNNTERKVSISSRKSLTSSDEGTLSELSDLSFDSEEHRAASKSNKEFQQVQYNKKSSNKERRALRSLAKRNAEFHRIFQNIPPEETLLSSYSCALSRDILIQGRIWFSPNWFCFFSNIFGMHTRVIVPFTGVIALRKKSTAKIFPNGIEVCTSQGKYNFASFVSRDHAFQKISLVWKNAIEMLPLAATDLNVNTNWDTGSQTRFNRPSLSASDSVGFTYVDGKADFHDGSSNRRSSVGSVEHEKGLHDDKDIEYSSAVNMTNINENIVDEKGRPRNSSIVKKRFKFRALKRRSAEAPICNELGNEPDTVTIQKPVAIHATSGCTNDTAPISSKYSASNALDDGREVLNEVYSVDVETLFNVLLTDNSFYRQFYGEKCGIFDFVFGTWINGDNGTYDDALMSRESRYKTPNEHKVGPRDIECIQKDVCVVHEVNQHYIIDSRVFTPNVPYGDSFYTHSRYHILNNGDGKSHLIVQVKVAYVKSLWGMMKKFIETNAYKGLSTTFVQLGKALHAHYNSSLNSAFDSTEVSTSRSVVIPKVVVEESASLSGTSMTSQLKRRLSQSLDGSTEVSTILFVLAVVLFLLNALLLFRVFELERIVSLQGQCEKPPVSSPVPSVSLSQASLDRCTKMGTAILQAHTSVTSVIIDLITILCHDGNDDVLCSRLHIASTPV